MWGLGGLTTRGGLGRGRDRTAPEASGLAPAPRITCPHRPRSRQCHCDKCDREYRPLDGICFEPSIECVLVLRGQLLIVKCYVALSHDTPLRLVSDELDDYPGPM